MDVRFTVGEMAALNGISKQTLIFYDKEGVLKPKYQDSQNNYRYYTADQLEELDSILILREMGLSLKEIKQHMQNRSPETALDLLEKQGQAVKEKIHRLNIISRRIHRKMEVLRRYSERNTFFEIREVEAQLLAISPVQAPGGLLEVDVALKELLQQANYANAEHFYQIGDIIDAKDLQEGNFLKFRDVLLPILKPNKQLQTIVKCAGLYAVGYHYGPYTTMGETYRDMLEKMEQQGKKAIGDAYEFCIFDNLTSLSPMTYCTEIQIPIRSVGSNLCL